MEIIKSIEVCIISWMNFNYKENGLNFFFQIQSINIMYPNVENMIVAPYHKKNGDYYENPSLTHFTDEL